MAKFTGIAHPPHSPVPMAQPSIALPLVRARNTQHYGRPLAGGPGPIGVGLYGAPVLNRALLRPDALNPIQPPYNLDGESPYGHVMPAISACHWSGSGWSCSSTTGAKNFMSTEKRCSFSQVSSVCHHSSATPFAITPPYFTRTFAGHSMHRSAWNENSQKFAARNGHIAYKDKPMGDAPSTSCLLLWWRCTTRRG